MNKRKEKVLNEAVVIFLINPEGNILLAQKPQKKRGEKKIAEGKWNGLGGGIDEGETKKAAAIRETLEETRRDKNSKNGIIVKPEDLELRAVVYCRNIKSNGESFKCKLFVFFVEKFSGIAEDSEEMKNLTPFAEQDLPRSQMIPSDLDWLPLVWRQKKKIIARVFLKNSQSEKWKETQIRQIKRLSCNN